MMSVSIYSTGDTVASITVLWIRGAWGGFFGVFSLGNVAYLKNKASVFGTKLSKLETRLQEIL